MTDIGEPVRRWEAEPLQEPVPRRPTPQPSKEPEPLPERPQEPQRMPEPQRA